ncbi:hypothetical protein BV898_17483 [Hypsibius exemplaris]|uniref:Uncharacterized protein n=1 Tax=Hypsibius exemplaris TaxID=2072580 RepID=A0A9X6RML3_HYPEX|nr:hypothetical protein BV898_17483 [Hypsibius exemplaris]
MADQETEDSDEIVPDIDDLLAPFIADTDERVLHFERLLNWITRTPFHSLPQAELHRAVTAVLNAFQTITLVYVEDWQAVFDCFDMLLYRLKSAGHPLTSLFWKTLLSLAGRLALEKIKTATPESSTPVLRPLYTTSSVVVNLHGADSLMDCFSGNGEDFRRRPFLLELILKFAIRGLLFFPHWTFPTEKTAAFFVQSTMECPVSIIRRAALEGMRVLHVVKGKRRGVQAVIERMLDGDEQREARAAFVYSVEQPVLARLDYSAQSVQMWLDVRDRGKGPELPADIAWVALAGDELLHYCVSTRRTHRIPVVEAGDAPIADATEESQSVPKSDSPTTTAKPRDQGAGDRPAHKKRIHPPQPADEATLISKLTSNTSLGTYNVDDIPVISAGTIGTDLASKLTGWMEKEENIPIASARIDTAPEHSRLSDATVVLGTADGAATKVVKKRTLKGKSKPKKPIDLEQVESAQDFYIGSPPLVTDQFQSATNLPVDSTVDSRSLTVGKVKKSRKSKAEPPRSPSLEGPPPLNVSAQTIRLSKTPGSQFNSTWESIEVGSVGEPQPMSAISRERVARRRPTKAQPELLSTQPQLIPQPKLIHEEWPDSEGPTVGKNVFIDELPVIADLVKKQRAAATLPRPRPPVLDTDTLPTVARALENSRNNLKTARVHIPSEFDSGLGISEELSPRSRPASRKYRRSSESAIPGLTLNRAHHPAGNYPDYDLSDGVDDRNYSLDQNSLSVSGPDLSVSGPNLSVSGPQTSRSGRYASEADIPAATVGRRSNRVEDVEALSPPTRKLRRKEEARTEVGSKNCFWIKPKCDSSGKLPRLGSTANAISKESRIECLNDDMVESQTSKPPLKGWNRLVEPEESEGAFEMSKKPEEIRLDLQALLDRMQKGPRYSNDILLAIEEFVELTKSFPRVIEGAIGAAFSQFLPLIYSLNSHVAAEAVAALEILMPLVESRLHLVAPQIVEALSNNMQNARTSDHSKTVFNQILDFQVDRAGTLLAPLSSHITTIMKKNKKEAFAFITGKYAETLGSAYPKPPRSQAAAVQILQFVKSVLVWITNYGDLDSSTKPEIIAVDALIQQSIRSFGREMVNKVCYDYRDTIKIFMSRREGAAVAVMPKPSGVRLQKLVTRKSTLMAFKKKVK